MGKKELKVALFLAWRSLIRGNRSSTIMTVIIIALCFTNMIFLPGLLNGIGQSITGQLVDYEVGNVLVSPRAGDQYITDLDATLSLINSLPGVERATPHYSKGATLKYRDRILSVSVRAISPSDEKYVSPLYTKMIAGSYLGAISHTLTALDVLAQRKLKIAAIVVSESERNTVELEDTVASIARFAHGTGVVGLPRLPGGINQHPAFAKIAALL